MKRQHALLALVLSLAVVMGVAASAAEAQVSIPISGGAPQQIGNFEGTFTVMELADQGGQVLAQGMLSGTLQTAAGPVSVVKALGLPATVGQPSCQTLHIEVGPQDLDLLGLMVHLGKGVAEMNVADSPRC